MDDDGSGNRASDLVLNARRGWDFKIGDHVCSYCSWCKCCESVIALATLVE